MTTEATWKPHEKQDRRGTAAARPVADGPWGLRAACRSVDPDLFFPVAGRSLKQVTMAKAICASCPVQRECLAFALRTRQAHGIWGGLTEVERRRRARTSGLAGTGNWNEATAIRLP